MFLPIARAGSAAPAKRRRSSRGNRHLEGDPLAAPGTRSYVSNPNARDPDVRRSMTRTFRIPTAEIGSRIALERVNLGSLPIGIPFDMGSRMRNKRCPCTNPSVSALTVFCGKRPAGHLQSTREQLIAPARSCKRPASLRGVRGDRSDYGLVDPLGFAVGSPSQDNDHWASRGRFPSRRQWTEPDYPTTSAATPRRRKLDHLLDRDFLEHGSREGHDKENAPSL